MIRRIGRRLNHKYVGAPHVFLDLHACFAVLKGPHHGGSQAHAEIPTDTLCQGTIRVPGEDLQICHYVSLPERTSELAASTSRSLSSGPRVSTSRMTRAGTPATTVNAGTSG